MDPGDLGAGLDAQFCVEIGERFVHQEHGRLADDRPTEGDALALPTGQLLRLAVEVLVEAENARRVGDALLDVGLRDLSELEPERHIVADGHVRIERVALEHHRDVAILGRDVVDDAVADAEGAIADLLETGDHPKIGGLATARWSDEHHELAIGDLEVEIMDRGHVTVFLGDMVERNGRHIRASTPPGHRGSLHPAAGWRRGRTPYEEPARVARDGNTRGSSGDRSSARRCCRSVLRSVTTTGARRANGPCQRAAPKRSMAMRERAVRGPGAEMGFPTMTGADLSTRRRP